MATMLRGKAALLSSLKAKGGGEGQTCTYSHRACSQRRVEGYEFCMKHILEDKASPFKQCGYAAPRTSRRCTNAAPKLDRTDRKEGKFCQEHHKRWIISRQRAKRQRRPKETAETLLGDLSASNGVAFDASSADTKRLRRSDSIASKALEYGSSSDSDTEPAAVDQAWRRDNDSDAESIDSDQEDPLKHAGVYSQEEAALLLRDKLIRLQSLYIDQFKRLQHVLKEKRRKFLHTYKQERERLGPIQAYKQDMSQRKKYNTLMALKRYHKFFGKEALLHQKCNSRRIAVAEGVNHRPPTFPRCIAPMPDGRCNKRVVPASKYCMAHILKDPHQVLFEPCSFRSYQCGEAVFSLGDPPLCRRHLAAAAAPSFTASSSQTEDPVEVKTEPSEVTAPVDTHPPSSSANETDSHSGFGEDMGLVASSGGMAGIEDEPLNSSGEGNLDIGDLDLGMEPDDLIRLVDANLFN